MKSIKLIISGIAIFFFSTTSILLAQTYKQQLKSTEIINRMFEGKLKFTPEKTMKITPRQLQKEIESNDLIPAHLRDGIYNSLVTSVADIKDWRGIVAEVTTDCGAIRVLMISTLDGPDSEPEANVEIFIPPNNKCGKLIEALYPALYGEVFGGKDIKAAQSKACMSLSDEVSVCADVLFLYEDNGQVVYTVSDCESNTDCSKPENDDTVTIWWDLTMEEK